MMTTTSLKSHTVRDLAAMAKKKKVAGWHMMRKDQLIDALVKQGSLVKQGNGRTAKPNGSSVHHDKKVRNPRLLRQLDEIKAQLAEAKDLAVHSLDEANGHSKDRLVVMVRDPYWLHAYWELSRRGSTAPGRPWASIGTKPIPSSASTRSAATVRPRLRASWFATSKSTAA